MDSTQDTQGAQDNLQQLGGLRVAVLLTDGFEQVELTGPREALERAGASVSLISTHLGQVHGLHHVDKGDAFDVDLTFDDAEPEDFDAVLLPGGVVNADQIRISPQAQQFVRRIQDEGKIIAVICHGAWLLVSAGLVKGRTLTSWPTLQDDINNAGGHWVNQQVAEDGNWISSRRPGDIPAFNEKLVERLSERINLSARGTSDQLRPGATS
ncbi:protease I [Paucimonas lemoignei]|uniref:Protease I n=1 Tax=Paucimonas lemoignei TaxID=29443 RepID=A0A4R3I0R3_PAULE|nr:type 1 glutamine amidotransferase domain-containing protein [Paucimonas lemoignei]TCS37409.1 protease I [Paucimonas lemoignei]